MLDLFINQETQVRKPMYKVFSIVFAVLFLISAGLQWNDPDPYLWIPLYLLSVLSCAYAFKGMSATRLNIFNIAVYLSLIHI